LGEIATSGIAQAIREPDEIDNVDGYRFEDVAPGLEGPTPIHECLNGYKAKDQIMNVATFFRLFTLVVRLANEVP